MSPTQLGCTIACMDQLYCLDTDSYMWFVKGKVCNVVGGFGIELL